MSCVHLWPRWGQIGSLGHAGRLAWANCMRTMGEPGNVDTCQSTGWGLRARACMYGVRVVRAGGLASWRGC